MMYKKNVVAAIKVDGKVLREQGETVTLPFGSEYSVLLKNLNTVRVMAKVTIDGQDITGNRWLVIDPNGSFELERFIRDGNLSRGNKLKFIERNEAVEEARGVQVEDGLVRVEWKTEKVFELPKITYTHHYHYDHHPWPRPFLGGNWCGTLGNSNVSYTSGSGAPTRSIQSRSLGAQAGGFMKSAQNVQACNNSSAETIEFREESPNDAGITVPGSESQQSFRDVLGFETEPGSEVLVLKLVGRHGETVVKRPVTVDLRPTCQTCHRKSKAGALYCSTCGTSLKLI